MTSTVDTPRNGKFIQIYTGGKFWPLDPRAEEIDIRDIAHALSNQCRFSGHSEWHYSVAQHSVYVSFFADNPLEGLLHDASEAYLVDVPRPIKPVFPQYIEIEANIMKVIGQKFGFPVPISANTTLIDNAMLWIEKDQVIKPGLHWFQDATVQVPTEMKDLEIMQITPEQAEIEFLARYEECVNIDRSSS